MIAPDRGNAARHEQVGRFLRMQRTGQDVPKIHHQVHIVFGDVIEHRGQGAEIAVYVGQDSDSHSFRPGLWLDSLPPNQAVGAEAGRPVLVRMLMSATLKRWRAIVWRTLRLMAPDMAAPLYRLSLAQSAHSIDFLLTLSAWGEHRVSVHGSA